MQSQLLAPLIFSALFATSALAKERPVTNDERTKLAAAVAEQGCSGGKMAFDIDDNQFEVDEPDATTAASMTSSSTPRSS
jgi:Fe-S cluster assembly iron-binding protein IscA